jgi:hypothetical protein
VEKVNESPLQVVPKVNDNDVVFGMPFEESSDFPPF